MGFFRESPSRMRRAALERGANPERWVPTFVDLGRVDGGGGIKMNYSFAIASKSDLLFYDCDVDLYEQKALRDPFAYARRYNGRVPIDSVLKISSGVITRDTVSHSRKSAFWGDLALNKTVGAIVGGAKKSVTMAALVVVQGTPRDTSRSPHLHFGIPHAGDIGGSTFGFIGDLLPESLSMIFEIGSLAHEYAQASSADDEAGINALTVAHGLLALMGRGPHAHTRLPDDVVVPKASSWTKA